MKTLRFMLLLSLPAWISGCNDEKVEEILPVFSTEFLLLKSWSGGFETGDSDFPVIMLFIEDEYGRIKTPENFLFRDFAFSVDDGRNLFIDVADCESAVDGVWTLVEIEEERMLFQRKSGDTEGEIMELKFGTTFRLD